MDFPIYERSLDGARMTIRNIRKEEVDKKVE